MQFRMRDDNTTNICSIPRLGGRSVKRTDRPVKVYNPATVN